MSAPATSPALGLADREQVLEHAAELILDSWRSFDHARPGQPPVGDDVRALLARGLPEEGRDARGALDDAARVLDMSIAQARPRYFAYIGSSGLEMGVLGDALMASHDVNVAAQSGGADLLEAQAVAWIGRFVGFGGEAGITASGGTVSNLTALCAARERALPGVRHEGIGERRLAVYTSAEAHYSVRRAAEVLGIGGANVRAIPLAEARRMDAGACGRAIDEDLASGVVPMAVVATAGTTLTGAVDDLAALADVCAARGVWLHVDGAYGLPAASTATGGPRFAGLDRADSATVDAHKWLYVPKACSVLLVRDPAALAAAFAHHEAYMPHEENEPQGVDRTLEYSRPLRALKLWLAFEVHGAAAIRGAIERNLGHAALLAALVEGHPDLELVVAPQLSVVCFRHRAVDSVRLTHLLQFEGRVYVSGAEVDGAACLRACFVNHRTTDEDVHALVDAVVEAAGRL